MLKMAKRAAKAVLLRTRVLPEVEFRLARQKLLSGGPVFVTAATHGRRQAPRLSDHEQAMLRAVSLRVSSADAMYRIGQADHYLVVGLSAIRCIASVLEKTGVAPIRAVLDFACGHGRVLRFLKLAFPEAGFTAAEVDRDAVAFCRQEFSVEGVVSSPQVSDVHLPGDYDLIWCGSLLTHLPEEQSAAALRLFRHHLRPEGVCIVTTHGPTSAEWVRTGKYLYSLSAESAHTMLDRFSAGGYGYVDYDGTPGYGVSLISPERMRDMGCRAGFRHVFYGPTGWDEHQDVHAFQAAS